MYNEEATESNHVTSKDESLHKYSSNLLVCKYVTFTLLLDLIQRFEANLSDESLCLLFNFVTLFNCSHIYQ